MRVLVTGGAGFIGSHVVDRLLELGHRVGVFDDFSTGREANLSSAMHHGLRRSDVVEGDIADGGALETLRAFRPEGLLLLAAQPSVQASIRDPLRDARVNVIGLVSMLEYARTSGVQRVVFASSGGTIYGHARGELPLREDACKAPISLYGLSKLAGGEYVRLYADLFGVAGVVLALGNVYGPRQDPTGEAGVIAIFSARLLRHEQCVINGDGRNTRDYVHVRDVADAFARALERGNGLINIGTAREISVLEVYETLARHLGVRESPTFGPAVAGEVRRVALDNARARSQLDWTPRTDFFVGTRAVIEALRGEVVAGEPRGS